MQDNDPIRRACLGSKTNNPRAAGEEVCNLDGQLGLVLPIPATDFIPAQNPGLVQYPTNACTNSFVGGSAPAVFTCPLKSAAKHSGECPNGDSLIGGLCVVPVDATGGSSQCVATKATVSTLQNRSLGTPDGRVYNLHMHDGTAANDGSVGYVKQQVVTSGGTVLLDFAANFGRIHQVETIFASGGTPPVPCHSSLATDQIGCLVQADPCSIGFAGDGARTDNPGGVDALRVSQLYATSASYPLACPGTASCQY
jgi:hypothetical protein